MERKRKKEHSLMTGAEFDLHHFKSLDCSLESVTGDRGNIKTSIWLSSMAQCFRSRWSDSRVRPVAADVAGCHRREARKLEKQSKRTVSTVLFLVDQTRGPHRESCLSSDARFLAAVAAAAGVVASFLPSGGDGGDGGDGDAVACPDRKLRQTTGAGSHLQAWDSYA